MDPIIQRSETTGLVTVNGQALGPAYFECKRDYKNYSEAMNLLLRYVDTGLTPEEIQEAVDLFQGADDIPNEIKSWVERCTWHVRKCAELSKELQRYKDTGLEPEEVQDFVDRWKKSVKIAGFVKQNDISRIKELLQAESEGRLIVLPCKVGDTVWRIVGCGTNGHRSVQKRKVLAVTIYHTGDMVIHTDGAENRFGKTVFLTREAAEAALGGGGE